MNKERKIKDGQQFGMLTVIKSESRNYIIYCYCKCECGNEKWIRAQNIYGKQQQKSCGCQRSKFERKDITGRKCGMLTVKGYTGKGIGTDEIWLCQCDCGNEIELKKIQLNKNRVTNCGCKRKKSWDKTMKNAMNKLRKKDLVDGTSINKITETHLRKNNTSGYRGVVWEKHTQKWIARITFKSNVYFLGSYKNIEDAIKARKEGEEKYHKQFLEEYTEKK